MSTPDEELAGSLESLDRATRYARWIYQLCTPHLGRSVLEVGAGHGTFTSMLEGDGYSVVATEVSQRCVALLRDRFASSTSVEVISGDLSSVRGSFDSVLVINVVEHVSDDAGFLERCGGLLRPGGCVIVWSPALPSLYSEFDRRVGHFRRYRRRDLVGLLSGAGLRVVDARYVNPAGAIGWFVWARLLRRTPTAGAPIWIFDRWLVPVLKRIERRISPPFGQSVFAVAVRPVSESSDQ